VNPARSTGVALFAGGWAIHQLWLFWMMPLIGGAAGGWAYRWIGGDDPVPVPITGRD
jgi:aquaporin Z